MQTFTCGRRGRRPLGSAGDIADRHHGDPDSATRLRVPFADNSTSKDLTITTAGMITHRFSMDEFDTAYQVFGDAAQSGALKVLISAIS